LEKNSKYHYQLNRKSSAASVRTRGSFPCNLLQQPVLISQHVIAEVYETKTAKLVIANQYILYVNRICYSRA